MTPPPVRRAEQRVKDTLRRDGVSLLLATASAGPTGRNLRATGRARLGLGPTRDVVIVEGVVDAVAAHDLPEEEAELFAAKTGFDPRRRRTPYTYYRIHPRRVQAWCGADEHEGRELMRDGRRLVADRGAAD